MQPYEFIVDPTPLLMEDLKMPTSVPSPRQRYMALNRAIGALSTCNNHQYFQDTVAVLSLMETDALTDLLEQIKDSSKEEG